MFRSLSFFALSATLFTSLAALSQTRGDRGSLDLDAQIEQAASRLANRVLERREHYQLDYTAKQNLLANLRSALVNFRTQPGPGYPGNPIGFGMSVRTFSDDQCVSEVTTIRATDSCSMLRGVFGAQRVWSISLDGQCINTADTTFDSSCSMLQNLAQNPPIRDALVTLYTDDQCMSRLLNLDPAVDYRGLDRLMSGSRVWSVKVENRCINIPDTTYSDQLASSLIDAALNMRARFPMGETVQLFSDDQCIAPVTQIQPGDQCSLLNRFYAGQRVWSVLFRGKCVNIPDTDFTSACSTYSRPN